MFLNTVNRLFQGVEVTHCSWKILTLEMLRSFKWRLKFQISKLVCVKQEFILLQIYCESEDEINIF